MAQTYPCKLSKLGRCRYAGNKIYDYGFMSGTANYCRKIKQFLRYIKKCPLSDELSEDTIDACDDGIIDIIDVKSMKSYYAKDWHNIPCFEISE